MAATAAVAERPGSSFFAPDVRIQKLGALQAGSQPGTDLRPDVLGDIQRVEVTRTHNGASQYTITLNNWYTTTADDRRGPHPVGLAEPQRDGAPGWPRWKYNALELLTFGDRLRIDLRYWPEQGTDGHWVPMIAGPITDMRFNLGPGAATVVVSGQDDLSALTDRREGRHEFPAQGEQRHVASALELIEFPLRSPAEPLVQWPPFATRAEGPREAIDDGQSPLEFLQKLADRLDLEVFIEFADLTKPDGGVELHVEPARSAHPPSAQESEGGVYIIERGKSLLTYTPTIKVVEQYSGVRVRGRQRDRQNTDPVDRSATASDVTAELHDTAPRAVPGPEVRAHFFPGRSNLLTRNNETNLDDERGRYFAQVALRRQSRQLFTIEAKSIGLPRLRPGKHVEIRGLRPPFDGFFYVTRTVHSYGTDGYTTTISGRRPGMPLPPYGGA
jgi:hypothetical protein